MEYMCVGVFGQVVSLLPVNPLMPTGVIRLLTSEKFGLSTGSSSRYQMLVNQNTSNLTSFIGSISSTRSRRIPDDVPRYTDNATSITTLCEYKILQFGDV